MSHSFNKIWIHAIWSTKDRLPLIKPEIQKEIFSFITNQLKELNCEVLIINGMPDHVHCLFLQNPNKSISEIIKQIKGSSSHYINQQNMMYRKFAWQTGFAVFSVSQSLVDKTLTYIKNQQQHHKKRTFQSEWDEFLKLYAIHIH